jgi:hypothetical protein
MMRITVRSVKVDSSNVFVALLTYSKFEYQITDGNGLQSERVRFSQHNIHNQIPLVTLHGMEPLQKIFFVVRMIL